MNLLLLLSALLSALSGLGGSARAPVAVQAVAEVAAVRPAAGASVPAASVRPLATGPSLVRLARAPRTIAAPVPLVIPLWATRRRE